jgi:hyperosmotically inducible periplasmic protein
MNNLQYRKSLIAAAIAATLGLGVAGCDTNANQPSDQPNASQAMSDTAMTAGVKSKLALHRDLSSSDISVDTEDGTVTLTGSVNDVAARSSAETAARSFNGVNKVNNRLTVQRADMEDASRTTGEAIEDTGDSAAQAMSDTWITTKVKSVLLADSEANGFDVHVDTIDGVVTLTGELTDQASIDHVEGLVTEVEGVRRVDIAALSIARR